jgi:5-methyltetrahydropteroyltriglutamate--homocysteine methyltransferase
MVQFDEPSLVMDLEAHQSEDFMKAYSYLEAASFRINVLAETYFVDIPVEIYKSIAVLKGISAIGFDLVRGAQTLGLIKEIGFPTDKVVDGRNIWATDLAASLSVLESLEIRVGKDKLVVSTSCSLRHTAVNLEMKQSSTAKSCLG